MGPERIVNATAEMGSRERGAAGRTIPPRFRADGLRDGPDGSPRRRAEGGSASTETRLAKRPFRNSENHFEFAGNLGGNGSVAGFELGNIRLGTACGGRHVTLRKPKLSSA